MQLVIVAGGKGTRLQTRLGSLPKAMATVGGEPLLGHQISLARSHGFRNIVMLLGYGASAIREFLGDGSRWGVHVQYHTEEAPLGTAGALLDVLDELADAFLVMYGDVMVNVDLNRFWSTHLKSGSSASIFVHPNDHPADSDLVELKPGGRIAAFHPYPRSHDRYYSNLVNAALYIINRDVLRPWKGRRPADFVRHIFPEMLASGIDLRAYRSPEYLKDAGTPERLDAVNADYQSGRIQRGSFATPAPTVFLDRDGTINDEVDRVKTPHDLRLIEGAGLAIRRLNRAGYRTVVISNQPVVARGECTEDGLEEIHRKLETLLGENGAYLDAIFHCPHHPDKGFPGERVELKIGCDCRKPSTGLINRAVRELNLDLARSWLVGDSTVDIQTAVGAGIRSILVETGHAGKDGKYKHSPDFVRSDLGTAVDLILQERLSNPGNSLI